MGEQETITLPYAAYERIAIKALLSVREPYSYTLERSGDITHFTIRRSETAIGRFDLIPDLTTDVNKSVTIDRAQRDSYRSEIPGAGLFRTYLVTADNQQSLSDQKYVHMIMEWILRQIEIEVWGEGRNWKDQKIQFQKFTLEWNKRFESKSEPAQVAAVTLTPKRTRRVNDGVLPEIDNILDEYLRANGKITLEGAKEKVDSNMLSSPDMRTVWKRLTLCLNGRKDAKEIIDLMRKTEDPQNVRQHVLTR